nr:hypothetical protein [Tanacetum cinerariifolium]
IDRKKVIITEDSIRQALRLDDTDSVDCLPNEIIFVELARMGYEKPSTKLTFYQVKRKERQYNTIMRYQALKRKPVTEAQARKNMMVYLRNMAGFKMNFFKGEKEIEEEERKRKSKSFEQRAAKKQKIDEETKEIKTHLQIIPNDEDDVYTEATPLALKVPVVDYPIHHEYNKPFYKIIKADGTHQQFLSFITLLRNFDREDLEMMWKLALGFQNLRYLKKAQQLKPNLYDGSEIGKFDVVVIESSAEQAFWSQYSVQTDEPNLSSTTIIEVPKELPKVSMVNLCLKKLKFHLASFDMVVKERTTITAIIE